MATRSDSAGQAIAASGLGILVGLWLIIAPFILNTGGHTDAKWNSIIIGIIIAAVAAIRVLFGPSMRRISWICVLLGLWLILSVVAFTPGDVYAVDVSSAVSGLATIVLGLLDTRNWREAVVRA